MNDDYSQLKGLAGVYLEDSYVLSISESPGEFTFGLDAVLTPENPRFEPPTLDEQYCYVLGRLIFAEVTKVRWISRSAQHYTGATGEVDLGNIDNLSFDQGLYVVEGDWGKVEIHSLANPEVVFD